LLSATGHDGKLSEVYSAPQAAIPLVSDASTQAILGTMLTTLEKGFKDLIDKLDSVMGEEASTGVVVMNSLLHPELTVLTPGFNRSAPIDIPCVKCANLRKALQYEHELSSGLPTTGRMSDFDGTIDPILDGYGLV